MILWEAYLQRLELVLSDSSGNRTSGDRTSGGPPVRILLKNEFQPTPLNVCLPIVGEVAHLLSF